MSSSPDGRRSFFKAVGAIAATAASPALNVSNPKKFLLPLPDDVQTSEQIKDWQRRFDRLFDKSSCLEEVRLVGGPFANERRTYFAEWDSVTMFVTKPQQMARIYGVDSNGRTVPLDPNRLVSVKYKRKTGTSEFHYAGLVGPDEVVS